MAPPALISDAPRNAALVARRSFSPRFVAYAAGGLVVAAVILAPLLLREFHKPIGEPA